MSEIYAFTGPSKGLDGEHVMKVLEVFLELDVPSEARYGGAHGTDTVCAGFGLHHWPEARHRLYVPGAPHNAQVSAKWREGLNGYDVGVIDVPRRSGSSASAAYRARNTMMVRGSTLLIAFVRASEFYRSGEWMTINIADRQGVPVRKVVLP